VRNAPIVSQVAVQFIVKFMVDIEAKELEMSPAQLPFFCLRFGGKVLSNQRFERFRKVMTEQEFKCKMLIEKDCSIIIGES